MYLTLGDIAGQEYLHLHFLFIKPENWPLLLMDGSLMYPGTINVRISGTRNIKWNQIMKGETLASYSVLKCWHLKIDYINTIAITLLLLNRKGVRGKPNSTGIPFTQLCPKVSFNTFQVYSLLIDRDETKAVQMHVQ